MPSLTASWVDQVGKAIAGDRIKAPVAAYYHDPVGFARDCVNWRGDGLTAYQREILAAIPEHRRTAVRGPHGLGKSTIAAITLLWFCLTRDAAGVDFKVVATAGAWRQLIHYLFPEVHKWAGRLRWDLVREGRPFTTRELMNLHLRLPHGEAFAAAATNPALIEGAHADSLLFIYDESKAIAAGTFDACEGAFSGTGESYALALSTPGPPQGRFYDIHSRKAGYEDWWPRHVTLDEAIAADRISRDWAAQRAKQWGETSALYVNRVLGEFHAGDEDAVIPLAWAEAAVERWHAWQDAGALEPAGHRVVGVDVARFGSDRTVLAIRQGDVVQELRTYAKADTMATAGRVAALLADQPHALAVVDVIGIGAGVVDRLREQGHSVIPFTASASTRQRDALGQFGFVNARSAAWWRMRELLDPSGDATVALPPDDELLGDLTAPTWRDLSNAKIAVESKDELRQRIGRSTDHADAVIQAWETTSSAGRAQPAVPWTDRRRPKGRVEWGTVTDIRSAVGWH